MIDHPDFHFKNEDKSARLFTDIFKQVERLNGRILVHCRCGVSRSVFVVLHYLVAKHHIPLYRSYDLIKRVRPFICPNEGFVLRLIRLEVDVLGFTSVANHKDKVFHFYAFNRIKSRFDQ